jgi:hypothetical protein
MLAIFVGLLFIPLFALWDFRWANYPVIPFRFVVNRSVIGASLQGEEIIVPTSQPNAFADAPRQRSCHSSAVRVV